MNINNISAKKSLEYHNQTYDVTKIKEQSIFEMHLSELC